MCHPHDIMNESSDTQVEGISVLANEMDKAVVQAPCQQLSWQLGYLKRSVLFHLLPTVQDYLSSQ
jgi:hypothetical protein